MAVSLNDIKNKIASTKNTSQITNAMQMVSAAKLGKSEEAVKNFQIYASKVRKLLTDLLHGHEAENAKYHPMPHARICARPRQRRRAQRQPAHTGQRRPQAGAL